MSRELADLLREKLLENYEESLDTSPIGLIYDTVSSVLEEIFKNPSLVEKLLGENPSTSLLFVFRSAHTNEHSPIHEDLRPLAESKTGNSTARVHSGFFEISEIDERDIAHTYGHDYYGIVLRLEREGEKYRLIPFPLFQKLLELVKKLVEEAVKIGRELFPEFEKLLQDKDLTRLVEEIGSRLLVDIVKWFARRLERLGASIGNTIAVTTIRDLLDKMFSEEPASALFPVLVHYTYPTSLWILEPDMYIIVEAYSPEKGTVRRLVEASLENAYPLVRALAEAGLIDKKDLLYGIYNIATAVADELVSRHGERLLETETYKVSPSNIASIIREIGDLYYRPIREERKRLAEVKV